MTPLQIVTIIIVVECQGRFLLVQRSIGDDIFPGKWQNPGGKVELGETIENALIRELKEETGIEAITTPIFLMSYSWKKDSKSPVRLGLIFRVNLTGKIPDYKISLDPELSDFKWVSIIEAQKLDLIGKKSSTGTLAQLKQAMNYS